MVMWSLFSFDWLINGCLTNQNIKCPLYHARDIKTNPGYVFAKNWAIINSQYYIWYGVMDYIKQNEIS